ncbi:ABC transporter ATP-binding protein [Caldisalinibacter kiritimatiensis]|uniref:Quaternary amine transport ATP-binding protein n=1 Tax=Caldisalinibacter kiritimatiensis TaxID=1304284 RepID=R1CB15_9FIRM|nr:betaine/proline/choline family ABC transporter ATP-binding protein [Caldisalinibacter kiritimatiensis]EOC99484.1 L-proline glycine betaine ABC transport system permease protein ProV [Caldisalinibacter kiritimatiensis]
MIKFEGISKVYEDGFRALDNINLHVKKGELLVLIGPSGCGKTTTMRMINRLIEPTEGKIFIDGKEISTLNPVELRRDIGYVIQQIGLLPHMTIAENVALVPKLKKMDESKYMKRVDELLDMVALDPVVYKNRYPSELSGGQQQRVGVIRALAADPPIILMDEPFSALDPISREQLQEELVKLEEELKKTIVFVTHDMDEALKIADRICIMRKGKIVQLDTPDKILRHPKNEFVTSFIGEERLNKLNILPPIKKLIEKPITSRPEKGLAEALEEMRKNRVETLLVVDNSKKLMGIAGIWDLHKNFDNEDLELSDIMRTDIPMIQEDRPLEEAIKLITENQMSYLPVVTENGILKGVLTRASIIELMAENV